MVRSYVNREACLNIVRIVRSMTTATVLINNYNYGSFLKRAVDSALEQTYPSTEVIVVDDGSTDNSREILAQYKSQVISVFKSNGGQSSAFNAGFAAASGEILFFLDSDDFYVKDKVSQIVKIYDDNADIGWCFHTLQLIDLSTNSPLGKSRENCSRLCDFRANARRGKVAFYAPATSGLSVRRSLLNRILPMEESEWTRVCADRYVSTAALSLSPGYYLDRTLAYQGVHGDNNFNFNRKINIVKARSQIATAHNLRTNFPELRRLSNREFTSGVGELIKRKEIGADCQQRISDYWLELTTIERFKVVLLAFYRSMPRRRKSRHRAD